MVYVRNQMKNQIDKEYEDMIKENENAERES